MNASALQFRDFVGRTTELGVLLSARRRAAREGTGSVVFIEGEAGIGKSRLIEEFARVRNRDDVTVARCERYRAPYEPFAALDIDFAANDRDDVPVRSLARVNAIEDAMERSAGRAPGFTFVLDDAHWSDYATAGALAALASLTARAPFVLVCAYRPSDLFGDAPLARTFAAFGEIATLVALDGLDDCSMRSLLQKEAGVDLFTAKRLCAVADGNPYVAEELARTLLDCGDDCNPALLRSLRSATLARLDRLSDAVRLVIEAASAFANAIDEAAIGFATELEPHEVSAALTAACDTAFLKREFATTKTCYRFQHALAREIVYRSVAAARMRALHARVADGLQRPTADVFEIAYHRWSACDTVAGPAACEAAGDFAMACASAADAANEYRCALSLLRGDPSSRVRVATKLVRALFLAGRDAEAPGTGAQWNMGSLQMTSASQPTP